MMRRQVSPEGATESQCELFKLVSKTSQKHLKLVSQKTQQRLSSKTSPKNINLFLTLVETCLQIRLKLVGK